MDMAFVQALTGRENTLEHGTMDLRFFLILKLFSIFSRFLAFILGLLAVLTLANGRTGNVTALALNSVAVGPIKVNGHRDIKADMDDERRSTLVLIIWGRGLVDFTMGFDYIFLVKILFFMFQLWN